VLFGRAVASYSRRSKVGKRTIPKPARQARKAGARRKAPPPATVVSQIVDGLLSKFDPANTSWEEFERSEGKTVRGIRCGTDLPMLVGDLGGLDGYLWTLLVFRPDECELWLGFTGDELWKPKRPLAVFRYDDEEMLLKLFCQLGALNLALPQGWLSIVTAAQKHLNATLRPAAPPSR
jgi:hypothetical protein